MDLEQIPHEYSEKLEEEFQAKRLRENLMSALLLGMNDAYIKLVARNPDTSKDDVKFILEKILRADGLFETIEHIDGRGVRYLRYSWAYIK